MQETLPPEEYYATRDWAALLKQFHKSETDAPEKAAAYTEALAQAVTDYKRKVHDVHHKGEPLPGEVRAFCFLPTASALKRFTAHATCAA